MVDLREAIDAFLAAKSAWDAINEEIQDISDGPEWRAYEAAECAVIAYPCRTLDETREKARFFLDNHGAFDTLCNCRTGTEETLRPFLRSLLGEAGT